MTSLIAAVMMITMLGAYTLSTQVWVDTAQSSQHISFVNDFYNTHKLRVENARTSGQTSGVVVGDLPDPFNPKYTYVSEIVDVDGLRILVTVIDDFYTQDYSLSTITKFGSEMTRLTDGAQIYAGNFQAATGPGLQAVMSVTSASIILATAPNGAPTILSVLGLYNDILFSTLVILLILGVSYMDFVCADDDGSSKHYTEARHEIFMIRFLLSFLVYYIILDVHSIALAGMSALIAASISIDRNTAYAPHFTSFLTLFAVIYLFLTSNPNYEVFARSVEIDAILMRC